MGIFDKAKDVLDQHGGAVEKGLDALGDLADRRTGGTHGEQIDKGVEAAKEKLAERRGQDTPPA